MRNRFFWLAILTFAATGVRAEPLVPVGAAVVDITPRYPTRLTGYRDRLQESEGVAAAIHARALVIGSLGPDVAAGPPTGCGRWA